MCRSGDVFPIVSNGRPPADPTVYHIHIKEAFVSTTEKVLLAIDVGNSHTVCGIFRKQELLWHWRLKTDRKKTADELAACFHTFLTMQGLHFTDISAAILASVVPTQLLAWRDFCKARKWPLVVVDKTISKCGMEIKTDHPAEVGADRIVNAVAAFTRFKQAVIVVDFGTAITFDCVSSANEYLGGVIVPGIAISLDALSSNTAKLPRVDISTPPAQVIGGNTVDAIKSGLLFGYGSLVDGLVRRIKKEYLPEDPVVIATGGMAEIIAPYADSILHTDCMLTLKGLQLLYEENTPA